MTMIIKLIWNLRNSPHPLIEKRPSEGPKSAISISIESKEKSPLTSKLGFMFCSFKVVCKSYYLSLEEKIYIGQPQNWKAVPKILCHIYHGGNHETPTKSFSNNNRTCYRYIICILLCEFVSLWEIVIGRRPFWLFFIRKKTLFSR